MPIFGEKEFEKFIQEHHHSLVGYFQTVVPCGREDAEDLAQETWISVQYKYWRDPEEGGYNPQLAGFYTYVKQGFARFLVMREREKKVRRQKKRSLEYETDEEEHDRYIASNEPGPEEVLIMIEESERSISIYLEMLRLLFLCGGYPHQQLAFGFSRVIYGKYSERGIEGDPARVDREYGDQVLEKLTDYFLRDYLRESGIDDPNHLNKIEKCLQPLRQRLPLSIKELMSLDRASCDKYHDLHGRQTGQTCLQDYYARHKKSFAGALPDWCYKVSKKISGFLDLEADMIAKHKTNYSADQKVKCKRCKLRGLPPCGNP